MSIEDCVTIMAAFVPSVERQHIWGYTEEDLMSRWELWSKWDALYRMFGDKKKDSKFNKTTIPEPTIKGKALDMFLDNL